MDIKITKSDERCWVINDKWVIYTGDGYIECLFEEDGGKIPQEVYDKRDQLIYNNK
jgi:hypothetical protein